MSTTNSAVQPSSYDGMSYEQLKARIAQLESEKSKKQAKQLGFKVSAKGGVSVYGLNTQWPVTLYWEQWERLFEAVPRLKEFIHDNRSKLVTKGGE